MILYKYILNINKYLGTEFLHELLVVGYEPEHCGNLVGEGLGLQCGEVLLGLGDSYGILINQ